MNFDVQFLKGTAVADQIYHEVAQEVKKCTEPPMLAVILVGCDPASETYVAVKSNACSRMGIKFRLVRKKEDVTTQDIIKAVQVLNHDELVSGILIQLPLPKHIDENCCLESILPEKDVDGFHSKNMGRLCQGDPLLAPATAVAIKEVLDFYRVELRGIHCVIVGKGRVVGRPTAILLASEEAAGATVTVCDKNTKDLHALTSLADVLIVACGVHHLIDMSYRLKKNCVIIDTGMHKVEDGAMKRGYRLEGDVNFDEVKRCDPRITPVPGGIGPVTVASLLRNVMIAVKIQKKKNLKPILLEMR